ncbi:hypothetical protein VKT23_009903 [Stygiomarasmius scandens]|uniref:HNH nuclease domain-containing protein n=1 Tax=Marasmiellus scandens TaxID=2682957 RepID=A0ABR1JDN3_9AGAR
MNTFETPESPSKATVQYILLTVWTDNSQHGVGMKIPIPFILEVCKNPIKWLLYISQAIVGASGYIVVDAGGVQSPVNLGSPLVDGAHYVYISEYSGRADLPILPVSSTRNTTLLPRKPRDRRSFSLAVRSRDRGCVFSGQKAYRTHHLIKGRRNLRSIVPRGLSFVSLDDMRNGLCVSLPLHTFIQQGIAGILCTNDILTDDDVPQPAHPFKRDIARARQLIPMRDFPPPPSPQYILQFFILDNLKRYLYEREVAALNNTRADFTRGKRQFPDPAICQYMYGRLVLRIFWDNRNTQWQDLVLSARGQMSSGDKSCVTDTFENDAEEYMRFFTRCGRVACSD